MLLNTLTDTFRELGLDKKETNILLCLFEHGPMRVRDIATSAKTNRTTTYGILKSLIAKGLVSSLTKRGILEYQSIQPNLLVDYIERQRSLLETQKKEVANILPELIRMRQKTTKFPGIQFFEGLEGIKQAYEDTLVNNKEKILYDITGTDAVYKKMGKEWIDYYLRKRAHLGIRCLDIAPDSDWTRVEQRRDEKLLRLTKLLPKEFAFESEIDIYDDKVGIFSFAEDEPVAVIIEDKTIAATMKTLFRYIGKTLS